MTRFIMSIILVPAFTYHAHQIKICCIIDFHSLDKSILNNRESGRWMTEEENRSPGYNKRKTKKIEVTKREKGQKKK